MKPKIAIVTGGSSGLGYEISKKLIQHDLNVCLVGRDESKLLNAKKSLSESHNGVEIVTVPANIGKEDEVKKVFTLLSNYTINILFNAAGVGRYGPPENNNEDMIDTVFEGNLKGLVLMCTYGLRFMSDDENIIVNIMSTAAQIGRAQETVYCAAKWGARGYTEALRVATKGTKIKLIAVYPGGMKTPFWSKDSGMDPDTSKFMEPSDVADKIINAVLHPDSCLVSDITINRR